MRMLDCCIKKVWKQEYVLSRDTNHYQAKKNSAFSTLSRELFSEEVINTKPIEYLLKNVVTYVFYFD